MWPFDITKRKVKRLNRKWVIATTLTASTIIVGLVIGLGVGLTYRNNNTKYIFGYVTSTKTYHTINELSGKNLEGYTLWINTKTEWSELPITSDKLAGLTNTLSASGGGFSALYILNRPLSQDAPQGPCITITNLMSMDDPLGLSYNLLHLTTFSWDNNILPSDHDTSWKLLSDKNGYMRIKLLKQWDSIIPIQWDCYLLNATDNLYLQK